MPVSPWGEQLNEVSGGLIGDSIQCRLALAVADQLKAMVFEFEGRGEYRRCTRGVDRGNLCCRHVESIRVWWWLKRD